MPVGRAPFGASQQWSRALGASVLALSLGACAQWGGGAYAPGPSPADVGRLAPGQAVEGDLHCAESRCADWYRLSLRGPGRLRVTADGDFGAPQTDVQLRLDAADGSVVHHEPADGSRPRAFSLPIEPGEYRLVVAARSHRDASVAYRLFVDLEPTQGVRRQRGGTVRPRTPARTPRVRPGPAPSTAGRHVAPPPGRVVASEVLDVESHADGGISVLVEAGREQGLRAGLRGTLVDDGRVLATVEVEEVFDLGARVRLLEAPTGDITVDTVARIRVDAE
ncbi:MAG: hypothetical protein MJE66_25560 [Proteobacteria bacterium]|nr:hypothetical protein [Pseudomonadota bacterium]